MIASNDYTTRASLEALLGFRILQYGRLLAGCGLAFPNEVISEFIRLDSAIIRDDRAKEFLMALVARRAEIEASKEPMAIVEAIAAECGCLFELLLWLIDGVSHSAEPAHLARELARMAIAAKTFSLMQDELQNGVDLFPANILASLEAAT